METILLVEDKTELREMLLQALGRMGYQVAATANASAAANELRGTALEGGTKYPVSAGDVLYIPANTPHRTLVEPGKQLNVMVIKVQP